MRTDRILSIVALLLAAACSRFSKAEFVPIHELAVPSRIVYADAAGEDLTVPVYANGTVRVKPLQDDQQWISMQSPSAMDSDGAQILLRLGANTSFRRQASYELSLEGTGFRDTLIVRQRGIVPYIKCDPSSMVVDGAKGGEIPLKILSNIPRSGINMNVDYLTGHGGWVHEMTWSGDIPWSNDKIALTTDPSTVGSVTTACVRIWYDDAWKEDVGVNIYLTRTAFDGSLGTPLTFEELRSLASASPYSPSDGSYIEGIAVSDCDSPNMAMSGYTAYNKVDTDINARTAYLESADGSLGVRLLFADSSENTLKPGTRLRMFLRGTTTTREEDPERYTISGVTVSNFIDILSGDEIPAKTRHIAELTPEDIYTYVTLTGTEFVNKGGAYTNVVENYAYPAGFYDGWAALLCDSQTSAIYAPVNMLCSWRRAGNGVPQGAGSTSGIIVHEDIARVGDAGPYQIRVIDESGFAMSDDGSAYTHFDTVIPSKNNWCSEAATFSVAALSIENEQPAALSNWRKNAPDYNGLTVEDYGSGNKLALTLVMNLQGWFEFGGDGSVSDYKGLVATLSTADKSGNGVLATMGAMCWGTLGYYRIFPAHWCMEYAVGDGPYTIAKVAATGKDYIHMRPGPSGGNYQNGRRCYPPLSNSFGFADNAFVLPAEVLGKDEVRLRFRPYDDVLFEYILDETDFESDCETGTVMSTSEYECELRFANFKLEILN